MIKANVLDTNGKVVGEIDLSETVFGAEYNEALIHQVIVAQLANKRQGTKSTLTRTEVRGGGKKPWRQKGTGRARQGSIRAPQWIKGGIVFAPKPRDFSVKVNKQMKLGALCSALSEKLRNDEIVIVDNIALEAPKTKLMAKVIKNLGIAKRGLFFTAGVNETVVRAIKNIPFVSADDVSLINVYDVVKTGKCVFTKEAILKLMEVYR